MDSVFLDLDGLVEEAFPPIVFQRLRGKHDPICLANDPEFPNHKVLASNDSGPVPVVPVVPGPHTDNRATPAGRIPSIHDTGVQPSTSDVDARTSGTRHAAPTAATHLTIDEMLNALSTGKGPLYYKRRKRWAGWPNMRKIGMEKKLCVYLNRVLKKVREHVYGSETGPEGGTEWIFSAEYATKKMKLDEVSAKPDIVLIPKGAPGRWELVRSVGEIRPSSYQNPRKLALKRLPQYSRLMFGNDYSRRFTLLFCIIGDRMTLFRYDRCGVLGSTQFNVHKDPKNFLRIIVGLGLGEDFFTGIDPSFFRKGTTHFARLNEKAYEILETLHLEPDIQGRGTVALRVIIDPETRKEGVIKDQWVDKAQDHQEVFWLLYLGKHGAKNVAMLEDHQLVRFKICEDIVDDETSVIRELVPDVKKDNIETREHRRMLITPAGESLKNFGSLKELVSVFIDFAEGILSVHLAEVYHRDISRRNLVIYGEEDDAIRKGYIIDFDCAAFHKHENGVIAPVGTVPFMAISILKNNGCPHKFYYELESLFYTLIWICLTADGPKKDGCVTPTTSFGKTQLPLWCGPENHPEEEAIFLQIANNKSAVLIDHVEFENWILSQLPSYFTPIRDMLKELRHFLFRPGPRTLPPVPPLLLQLCEESAALKHYLDQLRGSPYLKERADAEEAIREFINILKKTSHQLEGDGVNRVHTEPASVNEGKPEGVSDYEVDASGSAAQCKLLQARSSTKQKQKPEGGLAVDAKPKNEGDSNSERETSDLNTTLSCLIKDSQPTEMPVPDHQSRNCVSSGSRTAVSEIASTSISAFSKTVASLRAASLADKDNSTRSGSPTRCNALRGGDGRSVDLGSRHTNFFCRKRAAPETEQSPSALKRRR